MTKVYIKCKNKPTYYTERYYLKMVVHVNILIPVHNISTLTKKVQPDIHDVQTDSNSLYDLKANLCTRLRMLYDYMR